MPRLRIRPYRNGDETVLFGVGHRSPDGCDYVLNQQTGDLEPIWAYEIADCQGKTIGRVETRSGWYLVDGITVFAKRLKSRINKEDIKSF